jgi:hypothetical protein
MKERRKANMTTKELYKLIKKIDADLCGIFDGIADEFDEDSESLEAIAAVEKNLELLMDAYEDALYNRKEPTKYTSYKNCVILRDKEDGEITVKSYSDDDADVMMRDVSKVICFSDCDDMWDIIKIVYMGREVEYTGWQPGMVMSYEYTETGDEAWSGCFPQWDH